MIASTFYFDHDYTAAQNDSMQILKAQYKTDWAKAYGVYWLLIETMALKDSTSLSVHLVKAWAFNNGLEADWLEAFLAFCITEEVALLVLDESTKTYSSNRLQRHKVERAAAKERRAAAGRARWEGALSNAKQSSSNAKQTGAKERIGKDRKGEENNKSAGAKVFKKPTLEELEGYFTEQKHPNPKTEASSFFDSYESKGWIVGKNPMKDWKAAVRNWMRPKAWDNTPAVIITNTIQQPKLKF